MKIVQLNKDNVMKNNKYRNEMKPTKTGTTLKYMHVIYELAGNWKRFLSSKIHRNDVFDVT